MIKLINGDCLRENEKIESGSVDLILTDLPYGTVGGKMKDKTGKYKQINQSKWDNVINTDKIMQIANRILRKNGKMILFANQPFTTELISKQIPNLPHCYNMYWDKCHFANCLGANKAPVSYIEDVLIFSKKNPTHDFENSHPLRKYFLEEKEKSGLTSKRIAQTLGNRMGSHYFTHGSQFCLPTEKNYVKLQSTGYFKRGYKELKTINDCFEKELLEKLNKQFPSTFNLWEGNKYKSNILKYKKDYNGYHPTQKPVALLEDLIKTFSNEGDLVVDLTMGSGSTGVACVNTNRNFIGIELDNNYFNIAQNRINQAKTDKASSLF